MEERRRGSYQVGSSQRSQVLLISRFYKAGNQSLKRWNNLPVGINITGNCYDDINVLNIAYSLESNMNYKNQTAKEVK